MEPKLNATQNNEPSTERTQDEVSDGVCPLHDVELQMVGGGDNVVCW
ncbi:MAG: hypothetical protein JNK75_04330 [Betaproteobacteria bacterium]|nr:hypothetical protein [Betaproteobacteria bacterium]